MEKPEAQGPSKLTETWDYRCAPLCLAQTGNNRLSMVIYFHTEMLPRDTKGYVQMCPSPQTWQLPCALCEEQDLGMTFTIPHTQPSLDHGKNASP